MDEKKIITEINRLLAEIDSLFHTDDGMLLIRHCGGLRFLSRRFDTPEECLTFVRKVYDNVRQETA